MSRTRDNIRRIADTENLIKRIVRAEQQLSVLEKSGIPAQRAIAYPNSSVVQNGSPGVTSPNRSGTPDQPPPNSVSDLAAGQLGGVSVSGDDVLAGALTPGQDPGKLALKDCATGEPIDLILNAGNNDGEAKFQNPEGWNIDGTSPDVENWQLGYYWGVSWLGVDSYGTDPAKLTEAAIPDSTVTGVTLTGSPVGSTASVSFTVGGDPTVFTNGAIRFACGDPNGVSSCGFTSAPPRYDNWQDQDADYRHQLAFSVADGGFVSSSQDSGLPAKYRNDAGSGKGLNNMRLCTPAGVGVGVSALEDGSFAFFEEDGFGDPATGAKVFHFDSTGKYKDVITQDAYSTLKV